jgi:hypothetical protein
MHTAVNEFQERRRQSMPNQRRLSMSRPTVETGEQGHEADARKSEQEDDLRIMQHFAREFIERSGNAEQL